MSASSTKAGRHNTIRYTTIALALLAGCTIPLHAGEIADLGRAAEKQANAGDHTKAVDTLRRAMDVLIAKGPLVLRRVQFITEPPRGFGLYQPRSGNVFRPGEPLIVYAEPLGVGWKAEGGVNHALIVTDFDVRTRDGKILGGQKEFGKFEFNTRDPYHEIMTHLTITVNGAPAASYVLTATYRDLISGKSATLELPFEIRQQTAI